MSYAEVASKGPKQSPEEAAAPQPPRVDTTEPAASASTSSLVDVDAPSVRTVPSDFPAQEVQTETQAARRDMEREQAALAAEAERAEADLAARRRDQRGGESEKKKKTTAEKAVQRAGGWLVRRFGLDGLGEGGAAGAVAGLNLGVLVGLSGWLGYRGWGLYDRGRLGAREVGLGLGLLGAVGVVEGVLVRLLSKALSKR